MAGIRGLDHHDELSLRVAAVNLRAGKNLDCARGHIEPLGPRLHENAGDFDVGREPVVIRTHPSAIHEFSAVDTARYPRFRHDAPHFDGGPGGPVIAW